MASIELKKLLNLSIYGANFALLKKKTERQLLYGSLQVTYHSLVIKIWRVACPNI